MSEEEKKAIGWLSALDIKNEYEAINKETILNLIEKLQFHLQATEQQREYDMQMIDELKGECVKKDAIIDLMAKEIEEHMEEEVYNFLHICDECKSNNEECHGDYCKETIIEYFTNKAKEEK